MLDPHWAREIHFLYLKVETEKRNFEGERERGEGKGRSGSGRGRGRLVICGWTTSESEKTYLEREREMKQIFREASMESLVPISFSVPRGLVNLSSTKLGKDMTPVL